MSTDRQRRRLNVKLSSEAPAPSAGAETGNRTVNYGLAGGRLDATEHLERAGKTVLVDARRGPVGQKVGAAREPVAG